MSRILAALRATPFTGKHPLPAGLISDITWFRQFAASSNGVILIHNLEDSPYSHTIECDSSLLGAGAYSDTHYFSETYPKSFKKLAGAISQLEAINLVAALKYLAPSPATGLHILVKTDNQASSQVLSTGKGSDPILCACARELWLFTALNNCSVSVVHTPGVDLPVADALSRAGQSAPLRALAKSHIKRLGLTRVRVPFSMSLLSPLL